jgi:hypothetical protein
MRRSIPLARFCNVLASSVNDSPDVRLPRSWYSAKSFLGLHQQLQRLAARLE